MFHKTASSDNVEGDFFSYALHYAQKWWINDDSIEEIKFILPYSSSFPAAVRCRASFIKRMKFSRLPQQGRKKNCGVDGNIIKVEKWNPNWH